MVKQNSGTRVWWSLSFNGKPGSRVFSLWESVPDKSLSSQHFWHLSFLNSIVYWGTGLQNWSLGSILYIWTITPRSDWESEKPQSFLKHALHLWSFLSTATPFSASESSITLLPFLNILTLFIWRFVYSNPILSLLSSMNSTMYLFYDFYCCWYLLWGKEEGRAISNSFIRSP